MRYQPVTIDRSSFSGPAARIISMWTTKNADQRQHDDESGWCAPSAVRRTDRAATAPIAFNPGDIAKPGHDHQRQHDEEHEA